MKSTGKKFLSDLKLYSDYLKWKPELNRYETWEEACEDIINGHRKKFNHLDLEEELSSACSSMKQMRVLASQRNLQFRYNELKNHNMRMFNCCTLHMCRLRAFQEIFYMGLCGCGVGVSLLKPFIENLPEIQLRLLGTKTYVIEDSIEGWSDALGVLLSSYCVSDQTFPEYAGYEIKFDYSLIRPKGSYISGGFKAPGHEGLQNSLEKIETLINNFILSKNTKFTPILAYDIICHTADSILSGGVRRSALSMIVDPNDTEMMNAKTGNWRQTNPQRARSNNSVLIKRVENPNSNRDIFRSDFNGYQNRLFNSVVNINDGDSDLGFVFINNWFEIFNPCFTLDTKILTSNGWRTFEELMLAQENGEDIYIAQDKRTNGFFDGSKEYWESNFEEKGIRYTKIGKVGKTGTQQDVYKLNLSCGRSVKATGNHKIATLRGMVELKDLIPGEDKVLIGISDDKKEIDKNLDYMDGFLCGLVVGDGFIGSKEAGINVWYKEDDEQAKENRLKIEYLFEKSIENAITNEKITSEGTKKLKSNIKFKLQTQVGNDIKYTLSSCGLKKFLDYHNISKTNIDNLHHKNINFKAGFIAGMFFTDGHVDYNKDSKSISCRITQSNKEVLDNISLVLQEMGVMSCVYDLLPDGIRLLPDSNRELKEYSCKASYRLVIPGMIQVPYLLRNLLYLCDEKINKLQKILHKSKKFTKLKQEKIVVSVEYVGKEDVYCLEENQYRTLIANGLTAARCFEIGMTPVNTTEDLNSIEYEDIYEWTKKNIHLFGAQQCNLNEINAEKCQTKDQFLQACKDATILGTLQASYTDFKYMTPVTKEISDREALLGISITGWMNNPKLFNKEWLNEGAEVCKSVNKLFAKKIGINYGGRLTTTKPAGNSSVVLCTSSGFHPEHAEIHFRIMQLNKDSDCAKFLEQNMNFLLEESVWSASKTDWVVFVPIVNPKDGLFKKDMKGVKHLQLIKFAQQEWVNKGKNVERCICPTTNHNISNTVIIDNKEEIINYIWDNQEFFTAVSFIGDYGDKDFNQAPFTSVLTHEEIIQQYGKGALLASGLIVDGLHYFDNNLWQACDCLLDKTIPVGGTREQSLLRKSWIDRAKKFSKNYFKNDLKKTIYCLKDVHLFHKWETITRQLKEVDFGEILKKPTYKDVSEYGAIACSGGSCELNKI